MKVVFEVDRKSLALAKAVFEAARMLGISERKLYRRMKQFGII